MIALDTKQKLGGIQSLQLISVRIRVENNEAL